MEKKYLVRTVNDIEPDSNGNIQLSPGNAGNYITVSKTELNELISNNTLVPGAFYKITGVHAELYNDGTFVPWTFHYNGNDGFGLTDGVYEDVPTTTTSVNGTGLTLNITVSGGIVTSKQIANPGTGYVVNDEFSVDINDIGDTGTYEPGFNFLAPDLLGAGTTIYLQAITSNTLAKDGTGEFWNPLYNQAIDGNGIWGTKASTTASFERSNIYTTGTAPYSASMARDSQGNLYVAGNDQRITITNTEGVTTDFANSSDFKQYGFNIAIDTNDNVYAMNQTNSTIIVIAPNGDYEVYALSFSFSNIYIDDSNRVFVFGNASNVYEFDLDTFTDSLFVTSDIVKFVMKDSMDNIIALEGENILHQYSSSGTDLNVSTFTTTNAWDMTIDSKDNIFIADSQEKEVWKYNFVSDVQEKIWENTTIADFYPQYIAVDSKDNVYFDTHYPNKLIKVAPAGIITEIDSTEFGTINDIIIDGDDNIFISDEQGKILKFFGKQLVVKFLGSVNAFEDHIAIGPDGSIYTTNYGGQVSKTTQQGITSIYATIPSSNPLDLVFDSVGNLFVSCFGGNTVYMVSPSLVVTQVAYGINQAHGLVVGPDDSIYVTARSGNSVYKIEAGGTSFALYGTTGGQPTGIVMDSAGNIFTCNNETDNVTKILPDGTSSIFATVENYPFDIVIDQDDVLYVVNASSDSISKILPDGTSSVFATIGWYPNSLAIDANKNLYAINIYDKTVSMVTPDGTTSIFYTFPTVAGPGCIISNAENDIYMTQGNTIHKKFYGLPEFELNEQIEGNDGQTGTLISDINDYGITTIQFNVQSGDWSNVNRINGNSSNAVTNIKNVIVTPPYAPGDKSIWGGYSWTNLDGQLGEPIDALNLDASWAKNPYDNANYVKAYDIIQYDYDSDWISRRYNVESSVDVVWSRAVHDTLGLGYSAIAMFMFGNKFDATSYYKGIAHVKLQDAYLDCINFTGNRIVAIDFRQRSYLYRAVWSIQSSLQDITCYPGGSMSDIAFMKNASMHGFIIESAAVINTFTIPEDKAFGNITAESRTSISSSVSDTSTLFDPNIKKVIFFKADGTTKYRYYNNSDVLVIADLNA